MAASFMVTGECQGEHPLACFSPIDDRKRMWDRGRRVVAAASAVLAFAMTVRSEEKASIWYRSSDRCPDGATFLAKLGDRAPLTRLASVGDHVDFVVTLGAIEGGSRGRLERQTERGTVAIREVDDVSCDNVADAIALSLALALDPRSNTQNATVPATRDASPATRDAPITSADTTTASSTSTSSPAEMPPRPLASAPAPAADRTVTAAPIEESRVSERRWLAAFDAGLVTGLLPSAVPRAALSIEMQPGASGAFTGLSLRAGAVGVIGSAAGSRGDIRVWIAAAHTEICPMTLGGAELSWSPCAGADVGVVRASATQADTSLWAAVTAQSRVRAWISKRFALDADVGADFPLTRYEIVDGAGTVFRAAPVGFLAALGLDAKLE